MDSNELALITECADQLLHDLQDKIDDNDFEPPAGSNTIKPEEVDLVLEIIESGVFCGYYFVEHHSRKLFWLEEYDAEVLVKDVPAVVSVHHLGTILFEFRSACAIY